MNSEKFSILAQNQFTHCMYILGIKDSEYSTEDDRLHNFKAAASLMNTTPRKALMGMMAKHTISIYDMCQSEQPYTDECWEEKLTDSINYLVLLKAVLQDEKGTEEPQLDFFTGIETDLKLNLATEEYQKYCNQVRNAPLLFRHNKNDVLGEAADEIQRKLDGRNE